MLSNDGHLFSTGVYEYLDTGETFIGRPDGVHMGAGDNIQWSERGEITTPKEEIEIYFKNGRKIRKVG